jgi:hypothetical protein
MIDITRAADTPLFNPNTSIGQLSNNGTPLGPLPEW